MGAVSSSTKSILAPPNPQQKNKQNKTKQRMETFLRDILPPPLLKILLFLESWTVRIAVTIYPPPPTPRHGDELADAWV
jgi:hypothetical protein